MKPSALDPERWRQIDGILAEALSMPPGERSVRVAEACGADAELRSEVEKLLEAHAAAAPRFEDAATASALAAAMLASVADDDAVEGRRIGPYQIVREIGRGGMGIVYLARDTRLDRHVALKVLPPYLGTGPNTRRRFLAEARALSGFDHPNIATLHDMDASEDGQLYMVFPFYEGETLEQRIARGPVPVEEAVEIATSVASGLAAAHARDIIHRDVKPSNVLLTSDGNVKLLDFGVAKVAGQNLTGDPIALGTTAYMSPEQARGETLDRRSDLWSLGILLHEMLSGQRPFGGRDSPAVIRAILHDESDAEAALEAVAPDSLRRVVEKLLCKDPRGRYQRTEDVLADLRAAGAGGDPTIALREPPPVHRPAINRLAVLPLANLTGDPDQEHLVWGIHDALITELGKVGLLEVLSRTSVLRFEHSNRSAAEVAKALSVGSLVEGAVSRLGKRLVITVQLVAASPERHLWAETYRTTLEDVFDIARDVARSVASELKIALSPSEGDRLGASRSVHPDAYEAYALGLLYLGRRSPGGHEAAQRHFRRAIQIDPTFAPAYAMLAEAHGSATFFGLVSPAKSLPLVRSLIEQALELDATSADAHTSLGAVRQFADWDWTGAESAFRRAIALNPSCARAHFLLADNLSVQRRYSEALASAERSRELDRFRPSAAFGPVIVLNDMREFDRAIERAEAAVAFFTAFWQGPWLLAQSFIGKGEYRRAVSEAEAAAETSGRTPMALGALGLAYALDGRLDSARQVLEDLELASESVFVGATNYAMIHGGLGEHDRAFVALEQAYRQRDMALVHLGDDVFYDPLRADHRFAGLLDRMGLDSDVT